MKNLIILQILNRFRIAIAAKNTNKRKSKSRNLQTALSPKGYNKRSRKCNVHTAPTDLFLLHGECNLFLSIQILDITTLVQKRVTCLYQRVLREFAELFLSEHGIPKRNTQSFCASRVVFYQYMHHDVMQVNGHACKTPDRNDRFLLYFHSFPFFSCCTPIRS